MLPSSPRGTGLQRCTSPGRTTLPIWVRLAKAVQHDDYLVVPEATETRNRAEQRHRPAADESHCRELAGFKRLPDQWSRHTTRERSPLKRNDFNTRLWKPAQARVGIDQRRDSGTQALRHWYAPDLLDAGESIRAVSEYLGHSDPGFTLRTYTHLMPSSSERTRAAIDQAFAQTQNETPTSETREGTIEVGRP